MVYSHCKSQENSLSNESLTTWAYRGLEAIENSSGFSNTVISTKKKCLPVFESEFEENHVKKLKLVCVFNPCGHFLKDCAHTTPAL